MRPARLVLLAAATVVAVVAGLTQGARAASQIGLLFTPSTALGGATDVTWGFRFQTTQTIDPNHPITITAPNSGAFTASTSYVNMVDLTTGADISNGVIVSANGSSATTYAHNGSPIPSGHVIALTLIRVNNPGGGTAFSAITLSSASTTMSPSGPGMFTDTAQQVSELAFSPSTSAGGATGVTWGVRFRTSSTGRLPIGGTITVTAPQGGSFSTGTSALIDLTTFSNLDPYSGETVSNGGTTATLQVGTGIPRGDLIQIEFYGATNPASGVAYSSLKVTTSADTLTASPAGAATFTPPKAVSGVTFKPSSSTGGASANWGLIFHTSSTGRVLDNGSIVLGVPPGTTFPTNRFQYTVRDPGTGTGFGVRSVSTSSGGTQVTIGLGGAIRAGDAVVLDVQGVTNPSGGVSAAEISLATSSDPAPVTAVAPASSPSGSVAGLTVSQTTPAAGATQVVWAAQFSTSHTGGLASGSGSVTFSAPAGTFTHNPFVVLMDTTSGGICIGICGVSQSTDGSAVTVTPNFTVSAGDVLMLEVHGSDNPSAASYPASAFAVATSSDTTIAHPAAGITFSAVKAPANVSVSPSTTAGGASRTAWDVLLTASSTGGIADDGLGTEQLHLALPAGSSIEPSHDFAVYDLSNGAFQEFAGTAVTGSANASFSIPAAVSPGDQLALVLIGVTSPTAGSYPGSSITVSTTSDTQAASPASGLTLTAQNLPTTDLLQGTDPAPSASDDRLLGAFTTSPTGELASSAGRWGSVTLTVTPGSVFSGSSCFMTLDLTTGERGCAVADSISGSADTVKPGFSVGAGDVVAFSVPVTNPAGGLQPPTGFRLNTSSDDGSPAVSGDTLSGTEGAAATGPAITIDGSCPASGTIGWGDGTQSAATIGCQGLIATLSGTHTYADFGSYATTGSADDGSHGTGTATIADAPLTTAPVTGLTATAGVSFSGKLATFIDANPDGKLSDFSATIDWGDGTTSPGTVAAAGGGFGVSGTHTYSAPHPGATVLITVNDAGGSTDSAVESLTVSAQGAPKVTLALPANGSTVSTAQPTFSGTAAAGASQVTVNIYAGGAVSSAPLKTLSASVAGSGSWSVAASAPLANGTYTAQAQQSASTGAVGYSAANVFQINAPPTVTQPPPGPDGGGGPPPGCTTTAAFGVIQAVGCLQAAVDQAQIPAPDKQALCTQLKLNATPCQAALEKQVKNQPGSIELAQAVVRVNGLDLTPGSGTNVVFDSASKLVVSSHANVQIFGDKVSLYSGALVLNGTAGGDVPALDVNLGQLAANNSAVAAAFNLGGFHLNGTLAVKLVQGATMLTAPVSLPPDFSAVGISGSPLSMLAVATADNTHDVQFNELYLQGPTVKLGGFQLQNLAFCYQNHVSDGFCQKKTGVDFGNADPAAPTWNATAKVTVANVTVSAVPPPPSYGIGFVNGSFAFAGAQASFADPGIQLGSGVFLNSIGGSLILNPTRITGTIALTVTDVAKINGALFLVVPQDGQQYTFSGNELGKTLLKPPLALPKITANAFAIAVGGSASLKIPGLGYVPLADGYLMYAYPSYVAAGGGFNLNLFNGVLVVDGGIQGAVNFANGQFDIEGSLALQINAGPLNTGFGVWAVVSSVGIGGCGQVNFAGNQVSAGVGYKWGQGLAGVNVMVGSCDLTPYQVTVSAASARAASAGTSLRVPAGLPNEMVKVVGHGGPPDVTITGPGGVRASTAGQVSAEQPPFMIRRDAQTGTTYIAIIHPRGGRYTISSNPGSPALGEILTAHGFTPRIRAHVTGHGARRRLAYSVNAQPGEKVTFVERGKGVDRLIGTTKRDRGTLSFKPSPGPGGVRQIIAMITENGAPVVLGRTGHVVLASYRAPGPRHLGRIRGLRASRTGKHVRVAFDRVPGAKEYVVLVDLRDGLRTDALVKHPSLRLTVPAVGPKGGTVKVRALGNGLTTVDGPVITTRILVPTRRHHRHHHRRHHHRHHH